MTGHRNDLPAQVIILTGRGDSGGVPPESWMGFRLDLGGVRNSEDLFQAAAAELMFPHAASGFDALLDLMSDLDWFGNDTGYVVDLHNLDQFAEHAPELLARFAALLPNLCDRWRSRVVPFRVILRCGDATRQTLRRVIDAANADLQEAAHQPWLADVAPAEVVECVD